VRTFWTVFVTLFLAELGDKTQLAVLGFATGSSRWLVFAGASLALMASTAVAVLVGRALGSLVPTAWLRVGAGALFLLVGAITLSDALPKALGR
jgi:putative Ca2+/H+ antiporter (TMEM165/GDT1 family)